MKRAIKRAQTRAQTRAKPAGARSVWLPLLGGILLVGPGSLPQARAQSVRLGQAEPQAGDPELPDVAAIEQGQSAVSSPSPDAPPGKVPGATRAIGSAGGFQAPAGIYGLEQLQGNAEADQGPAEAVPELHVVKKGDTLWTLCEQYFSDAWRWPQVWAQNPLITNPHWLFPGDVVRLRAPGAPAPVAPPPTAKLITTNRPGSLDSKAVLLRQMGFIDANDLDRSGEISGSREEKIMLATGDQAYVRFSRDKPMNAGDRYSVFVADREHPILAPGSSQILGYLVRIYSDILVDQISEANMARGTLIDATDRVERGYSVSPAIRQFKRIEPRASAIDLEARVLASYSPVNMLSAENFVVLGRGKRDGVEVGNRTFAVRRGDGYRRLLEGWEASDPSFPKEVVGELWVVDVRENTSIAWIVRSNKEIRVGEVTELRKGH